MMSPQDALELLIDIAAIVSEDVPVGSPFTAAEIKDAIETVNATFVSHDHEY